MFDRKNTLTPGERIGEAMAIPGLLALLAFFIAHQWAATGFFTAEFGPLEMLCLYGPIPVAFIAPIIRVITGQRHPALPFETATSIMLALGALYLLIVFPFDYTHLPDVLPRFLQFTLGWVTDGIARFILVLQVIFGPITAGSALIAYLTRKPDLTRQPL